MKTNLSLIEDNDDYFEIKNSKKTKSPYSVINLKKNNNNNLNKLIETLSFYSRNLPNIYNKNSRNKYSTYNINICKNVSLHNEILKRKTRNKTMKNLFKCNSENNLIEKINKNEDIITSKKNNFLLLTSLYKLPSINNKNILLKKPQSPKHFCLGSLQNNNNNNYISSNNSSLKKSFNDSVNTSIYNESFNNFINCKYNNEISKNNISRDLSQSKSMGKKKVFSNLNASLKDKYYSDIEKRLNYKLDEKLFPSDHSMKDKIIHMKKVSIFWNSVFRYCIPIINGQKYKLQHLKLKEKQLQKLDNNDNKYSNYYNLFMKEKDNNELKSNKSQSQKKIINSKIFNDV